MDFLRRLAGAAALAAMGAAGWFSLRLARADAEFRKGTPESVARAVEMEPLNAAYLTLRALQVEYAGGDARPLLEKIARITPYASAPRIKLGLEAETRGDLGEAEKWLLDASRVDRQYEPRWTLANFYFRQQRMEEFWKWIRSALVVSYGDRSAAFDLCWRASPDAGVILERAIPDRHEVLTAFVWYLMARDPGDAAEAAIRLSKAHDSSDAAVLNTEMDRLVEAGRRAAAGEVWRNLGHADPPKNGNLVVHPDFEAPRVGHGFDWRLIENAGVNFTPLDTPMALRISFDGMQPQSCLLVEQFVGVEKGKRYVLRWEARGSATGVEWQAGAESGMVRVGEDWMSGELGFVAAKDGEAVELRYARPLGEARTEGLIELRHIALLKQISEEQK